MSELTNAEKVQAALDAAIPSIVESLKQELIRGITYDVKSQITSQVMDTVTEWYKTAMVDEIKTLLVDSKLGFLEAVIPFAEQLQEQLLKGMVTSLTENLNQSYSRNKIMEALFK